MISVDEIFPDALFCSNVQPSWKAMSQIFECCNIAIQACYQTLLHILPELDNLKARKFYCATSWCLQVHTPHDFSPKYRDTNDQIFEAGLIWFVYTQHFFTWPSCWPFDFRGKELKSYGLWRTVLITCIFLLNWKTHQLIDVNYRITRLFIHFLIQWQGFCKSWKKSSLISST